MSHVYFSTLTSQTIFCVCNPFQITRWSQGAHVHVLGAFDCVLWNTYFWWMPKIHRGCDEVKIKKIFQLPLVSFCDSWTSLLFSDLQITLISNSAKNSLYVIAVHIQEKNYQILYPRRKHFTWRILGHTVELHCFFATLGTQFYPQTSAKKVNYSKNMYTV